MSIATATEMEPVENECPIDQSRLMRTRAKVTHVLFYSDYAGDECLMHMALGSFMALDEALTALDGIERQCPERNVHEEDCDDLR